MSIFSHFDFKSYIYVELIHINKDQILIENFILKNVTINFN